MIKTMLCGDRLQKPAQLRSPGKQDGFQEDEAYFNSTGTNGWWSIEAKYNKFKNGEQ